MGDIKINYTSNEDTGDINKINNYEYEDYVSAIREELHQDNPDLLVYCDKDEDMWEIYK